MTADKMRIWNVLSKTDPKHTKPFKRAGGFGGTAMKPIWIIKQMTELFGPAGTGWGMDEPTFQTVNAGDEILVFCTVGLWYNENGGVAGPKCSVYGVGGDKVLGKNKYGPFTNDEAFKAAYTDAMSNAMKQIGVGADIHMGLFDDDKYVAAATREFAREQAPPPSKVAGSQGRAIAAARKDIVDTAKPKMTPKEWADSAIQILNTCATLDSVNVWWKANDKALTALQEKDEAQYERIALCADDARASLRAHQ